MIGKAALVLAVCCALVAGKDLYKRDLKDLQAAESKKLAGFKMEEVHAAVPVLQSVAEDELSSAGKLVRAPVPQLSLENEKGRQPCCG